MANQSLDIDSKYQLDLAQGLVRRFAMSDRCDPTVPQLHFVLERIDPSKNMARYYVLSLEPTLFGNYAVVRDWGRLGAPGRRRSEFFNQSADACVTLEAWLRRKCKRGYVVRS